MAAVTVVFNTLQVHIVANRGRGTLVLYRGELVKMFNVTPIDDPFIVSLLLAGRKSMFGCQQAEPTVYCA